MNITNGQTHQFTPRKGDTQRLRVSLAKRNDQATAKNLADTTILIQPPSDPARRQEFWLDTCRGVSHMHVECAQVQELYRKHGCRFAEPTSEQVRCILDALDQAMPHWEKEHPELFYQTVELSFPELLIRR